MKKQPSLTVRAARHATEKGHGERTWGVAYNSFRAGWLAAKRARSAKMRRLWRDVQRAGGLS